MLGMVGCEPTNIVLTGRRACTLQTMYIELLICKRYLVEEWRKQSRMGIGQFFGSTAAQRQGMIADGTWNAGEGLGLWAGQLDHA
jgi:hypothetical protein